MPLPCALAGRIDDGIQRRLALGNLAVPRQIHVVQRPRVLERGARRFRSDGGRVGTVGVERRVEVDQVN